MAIKKSNTEAVNDYPPIRFKIRTEISDCRSLLFDPPCRNPVKSVPRGKAIWNANGGFVSVLLMHLFAFLLAVFSFFVLILSLTIYLSCFGMYLQKMTVFFS